MKKDLKEQKQEIKTIIKSIMAEIWSKKQAKEEAEEDDDEEEEEDDEEEEEEDSPKKASKKRSAGGGETDSTFWHISEGLMELFGVDSDEMEFKEVHFIFVSFVFLKVVSQRFHRLFNHTKFNRQAQKRMQEYIKLLEKDPSDGRKYISDDKLIKVACVYVLSLAACQYTSALHSSSNNNNVYVCIYL
jgi:hypothetical protein